MPTQNQKRKPDAPLSKFDEGVIQSTPEAAWGFEKLRRLAQNKAYSAKNAAKVTGKVTGVQLAMHAVEAAQLASSEEARRRAEADAEKLSKKGAVERMATAAFVDTPGTIYAAGKGIYDTQKTYSDMNKEADQRSKDFIEETKAELAKFEADEARRDAERATKVGGAPSRSQLAARRAQRN